jgi:hypothetical protein
MNKMMKNPASIMAKLRDMAQKKKQAAGPSLAQPKSDKKVNSPLNGGLNVGTTKQQEEETGMELGDDVIGKCMDGLEEETKHKPEPLLSKSNRPPSFSLSTSPPPTLQDCISPTGVQKFFNFKGPAVRERRGSDSTEFLGGNPAGAELVQRKREKVSRVQELLLRLSHSKFEGVAAVHSQDRITELFDGLPRKIFITERKDLQPETWYLVDDKNLGYGNTSNSVSAVEWAGIDEEKLNSIIAGLEAYSLSCIR